MSSENMKNVLSFRLTPNLSIQILFSAPQSSSDSARNTQEVVISEFCLSWDKEKRSRHDVVKTGRAHLIKTYPLFLISFLRQLTQITTNPVFSKPKKVLQKLQKMHKRENQVVTYISLSASNIQHGWQRNRDVEQTISFTQKIFVGLNPAYMFDICRCFV